jgi:YD repeat-containing protein
VTTPDGREIESYDANNNLSQVTTASGTLKYSLTYSTASTPSSVAPAAGLLIQVSDAFGHTLTLTYDSLSRLATMTDPNGGLYQYGYDANDNLTSVTYPDGKSRQYVYDESSLTSGADLPNALTGIVDENNSRYANFGYSATGLATLTEHAGGADHYLVNYGTGPSIIYTIVYTGNYADYILKAYRPPSGVTVTDGLGTTRNYGFTAAVGSPAVRLVPPCRNLSPSMRMAMSPRRPISTATLPTPTTPTISRAIWKFPGSRLPARPAPARSQPRGKPRSGFPQPSPNQIAPRPLHTTRWAMS